MSDPLEFEEELFSAALARPAPEREAFLRELGRERPAVAVRITALLFAHEKPTLRPMEIAPPAAPSCIGRYTLGEKLVRAASGSCFARSSPSRFAGRWR